MTQIWEVRGRPTLARDLHHLRRHHPLFSWMAPLQNTVRLRDYHDFFLMIFIISFWLTSLILWKRRGCYVLKCSGMQLTSFGFRQHRSSKVTKPGKMSTLPRTPGLPFHSCWVKGKEKPQSSFFPFPPKFPIQLIWQVREYTFQGGQCPYSKDTSTGRTNDLAT